MIVYVLFVHQKSVLKIKVCIIFIKNERFRKTPKNPFLVGFLGGFFGFFIANPACRTTSAPLSGSTVFTEFSSAEKRIKKIYNHYFFSVDDPDPVSRSRNF
jgi:hypothetical protein